MTGFILLLLLWATTIGASIECTKTIAVLADNFRVDYWVDRTLPALPFLYGTGSGAWLASDLAVVFRALDLPSFGIGAYMLLGLGVGAFAGQTYKAAKEYAPQTVRKAFDWWR